MSLTCYSSILLYNYCELYYRIQKVCSRDAVHYLMPVQVYQFLRGRGVFRGFSSLRPPCTRAVMDVRVLDAVTEDWTSNTDSLSWGMSWSLLNKELVLPREGQDVAFVLSFVFWRVFLLFEMALSRSYFLVWRMFWEALSWKISFNVYYDYLSCLNLMCPCVWYIWQWNIL